MMKFAEFIAKLLSMYSFLIWIRIILSWIIPFPRAGSITYYIAMAVDPFLNLFRSKFSRFGTLDFSPIFAFGTVSALSSLLMVYAVFGTLSLSIVVAYILRTIWLYAVSVYLVLLIISSIFSLLASLMPNSFFARLRLPIYSPFTGLFNRFNASDFAVSTFALIIHILFYLLMKEIFIQLVGLAVRIPF